MSPLPDVVPNIVDGNIGMAPAAGANSHIKVGLAPLGLVNGLTSIGKGDLATLTKLLGPTSAMIEAAALALQQGGPIYIVNANPSTYGAPGAVTKTSSSGTSALAVAAKPFTQILARCSTGGALGVAAMQFSYDGGLTWSAPVPTAATVIVPNAPFVTVAFSAGTYAVGDTWTISTTGTSTPGGSNAGYNGLTFSSASLLHGYPLLVVCSGSGALGAATFQYSLDNGNTWSGSTLVPSSGIYVVPNSGLVLTFTGSLVAGEAWSSFCTPPSFTSTDLANALNAALPLLRQLQVTTGTMHVVAIPATAAAAAGLASALETLLEGAAGNYQYLRGLIQVPTDTDSNIATAFASVSTLRVSWCAGFCYAYSPLTGQQNLVSAAFPVAARIAGIAPSQDLGYVDAGALPVTLGAANATLPAQRDESATPFLDAARFITLRTIAGYPGVFVTNGRLGAPPGSDYTYLQYGLVIDIAAAAARAALLKFLNASVRVNGQPKKPGDPAFGTLYGPDGRKMTNWVEQRMEEAVVQTGYATAVQALPSYSAQVLQTQQLPWAIGVLPLGYVKFIPVTVGFLPVTAA